jgi:signal transduction histidine kinase
MRECFNELVSNSLHWFNKDSKQVTITIAIPTSKELPNDLDSGKKYLKVSFADNGAGIPNEYKEKIFAPFFTKFAHGAGLGLALVKNIIEHHGGRILEIGKQGEGANFEIFMPAIDNRK